MAEPARRYEQEQEVDAKLHALGGGGLDRVVLANALLFGEAEGRTCTEDDPGILRGIVRWGRPIRYMREVMRPKKWKREEPNSLPLIVAPDRSVAITVSAGDEQTGNPRAAFAGTKWPKGNMLREWVDPSRQMGLGEFEDDEEVEPRPPELWILLVRRTSNEVISELSRPTSVTPEGRLRFGGDRIFLNALPLDQTIPFEDEDDVDEQVHEVNVERL